MPTLFQISIEVNSGSVGRIAEQIGQKAISNGWTSYITYARNHLPSQSKTIKIGNKLDLYWHVINTRIFDKHCLKSKRATRKLIQKIREISPDIIHLHHIHGYFINMDILFDFLSKQNAQIVWTFHDCWSFTGHCAYYDYVACNKWETACCRCPQKRKYPASYFFDRSRKNYEQKKRIFTNVKNMTIISVSNWLSEEVKKSFLKDYPNYTIQNGIDTSSFSPQLSSCDLLKKYNIKRKFLILGVATVWDSRKGLNDFIKLQELLDDQYQILLVGLTKRQIKNLPKQIIGIERTESISELAQLYTISDVHISCSVEETFGLTIVESMSCGTPVIAYDATACPELISPEVGFVVAKNDLASVYKAINKIKNIGKNAYSEFCRKKVQLFYDKEKCYDKYLELYNRLIDQN